MAIIINNMGIESEIDKFCMNNKKARYVNLNVPPVKLTYQISLKNMLSDIVFPRGIFIQVSGRGLLGVITEFNKLSETAEYPNEYLYCYNRLNYSSYMSEYGVVGLGTDEEIFYANGQEIQVVDIDSFIDNPLTTVLYRIMEDNEKHYYRYYSSSNAWVRVYFMTDIIKFPLTPTINYTQSNIQNAVPWFRHNASTEISGSSDRIRYIPSMIVSNNIAKNLDLPSYKEVLPIKMFKNTESISIENNTYVVTSMEIKQSSELKYYIDAELYYADKSSTGTYTHAYRSIPANIKNNTSAGTTRLYGGKLMLYYQEMHDYFAELFPDITDEMSISQMQDYINSEHESPYSFVHFETFFETPVTENNIKKYINNSVQGYKDIFPMTIRDVPNNELSVIYFCQDVESKSKAGQFYTYVGQPMQQLKIEFNVPYSVAFLNKYVPGRFVNHYTGVFTGKRMVDLELEQTSYTINPVPVSIRRCNTSFYEYSEMFIGNIYHDTFTVDPITKVIHTSGTINSLMGIASIYETFSNVDLTPVYENGEIKYWHYEVFSEYDPEAMGNQGSIDIRLYNNTSEEDNNALYIVFDFNMFTYGGLIGIELHNFYLIGDINITDVEGNISVTQTSPTSTVYIPYTGQYNKNNRKLDIKLDSSSLKYPIGTTKTLYINEQDIEPFLRIQNRQVDINFNEGSRVIIDPDPTVEDKDTFTLSTSLIEGSFDKLIDYYDPNFTFSLTRRNYEDYTSTIPFSKTMEWDTSKPLYLSCELLILNSIGGITYRTKASYELNYDSSKNGWYVEFYDEPTDDDYVLGYISLTVTNSGLVIGLYDANTYNTDYSADTITIRNSGIAIYQEEE